MISVIIPAYNAQAYLRECLESVLAQSFSDWEIIVVNDGSTDSTLAIAEEYATIDSRISVVTTPNGGLSHARNIGLDMSNGEWVTYLDSDDMLAPRALEILLSHAGAPGIDVVVGQSARCWPLPSSATVSHPIKLSGREVLRRGLYQNAGFALSAWAKLIRRSTLGDIRFPDGMYYEDLLYHAELSLRMRDVVVIGDVVYYYRCNDASFLNTFSLKRLDVLCITQMVERLCQADEALLRAARDRRLSANFNIYGLLSLHDDDGAYADVRLQCWQLIKHYRLSSLFNRHVRLKNKLGVLLSYLGPGMFAHVARRVYG